MGLKRARSKVHRPKSKVTTKTWTARWDSTPYLPRGIEDEHEDEQKQIMRKYKLRMDSTFSRLTSAQREQLEDWLFTDHLGYAEVLERMQKEFGVASSRSGVSRYCRMRQEERAMEDLAGVNRTSHVLNGVKVDLAALRESSLKLVGARLLRSLMEGAETADIVSLARLLLEADSREIQKDRLELDRERFHFNAAEAVLAELPHVNEMTKEDLEREDAQVKGIIRRLFGPEAVPKGPIVPEAAA
jgi:hypothetical protein